jgi:hypothetical protein
MIPILFKNVYVYCDIIQPQIVGNQTVPLLDIVRDEGKGKREMTHSTKNLHYVPLRIKSFEEVKVLLRSSTNERISFEFEHGHTSITLHFRQKKTFKMTQQGYGLGGVFRSRGIVRTGEMFKPVLGEIGRIGATVGADLLKNMVAGVINGKSVKEAARESGKEAGKQSINLVGKSTVQALQAPSKPKPKAAKRPRSESVGVAKKKKKAKKKHKKEDVSGKNHKPEESVKEEKL